ncbi:aminodeoxychorismate lyase [Mycetocola zhadangensis]|uniref:Aminodeoxychorismate lyase n=1 Tax=Mycetocola zhadangensis TaxID=1164595 RepID=A0A3L7J512_9MICO|nr:aminodeoxychorismate lyase [Mycetocola zhadangensis]RLQ85415.1 aminodeoxychorismate lyase [Mycetocola zhadangensis]GGE82362.1 4-amino-4-deoxychorismate lyase [Mycetocola zhadangensis]
MTSLVLLLDPLPADTTPTHVELESTMRFVAANEPILTALDAGAGRGDGIFETLGAHDGQVRGVDAHLQRLAASAEKLDLPAPHSDQWRSAIVRVMAELPSDGQASIRLTITRGTDAAGPTCWVTGTAITAEFPERTAGVRVVTLSRGYANDVGESSPWLLVGAKTLSYAINMAALREAKRRGADDVVFTSTDGFALEGPTSSLLVRKGNTISTPAIQFGILAGTTQADLFGFLEGEGFTCDYRKIKVEELHQADAIWLVSSVRLAIPVTEVDGQTISTDLGLTGRMNAALLS